MTETAETPPPARRRDDEALRLAAVVRACDSLGVEGFYRMRADLAAADRLDEAMQAREAAATKTERELADRLADGADLDDVAVELAGMVPALAGVAERAVRVCRTRAARSAAAEAWAAHASLARVVDAAVADAVAAGGELVDVAAFAARLEMPKLPRHGWPGNMHPWVENPPIGPVDLDGLVAVDPARAAARARAVAAVARVTRGMEVAGMLEKVGGPGSTLWGDRRNRDQVHYVDRLPSELQLAVAAALGWEPRLRETRPRPWLDVDNGDGGARARAAAVDAAVRTAPLHRVIDRVVGGRH